MKNKEIQHRVRNPLAIIKGQVTLNKEKLPLDVVDSLNRSIDRITSVLDELNKEERKENLNSSKDISEVA